MRNLLGACLALSMPTVLAWGAEKTMKHEAEVEHAGARLHAELKNPCVAGKAAIVTITLSNNGDKKVSYGHINYYCDFDLRMTDAKGKTVPLTRFGKFQIGGDGGQFGVTFKYCLKSLPPGASYSIQLNLARLFDLSVGGIYSLRIRRRINEDSKDEFVLDIKEFKIVVTEEAPKVIESGSDEKAGGAAARAADAPARPDAGRTGTAAEPGAAESAIGTTPEDHSPPPARGSS